ncbi:MAG: hypothetical protein ACO1TE_17110 [Prosthecobacter sp.]
MSEDFGISWRQMKTALLLGGAMGSVVMVAVPVAAWQDGHTPDYAKALGGSLIVALVIPVLTAVTMLFSVRIEDGVLSQRVFRRWRLRQGHVEDLTRVELRCGRSAARLYFENGTIVRLPMADTRELQALCVHLMECRPDFGNFIFSPRAARLEKVVQAFRLSSIQAPSVTRRRKHDRAEPGIATRAIPWGGLRRTPRAA